MKHRKQTTAYAFRKAVLPLSVSLITFCLLLGVVFALPQSATKPDPSQNSVTALFDTPVKASEESSAPEAVISEEIPNVQVSHTAAQAEERSAQQTYAVTESGRFAMQASTDEEAFVAGLPLVDEAGTLVVPETPTSDPSQENEPSFNGSEVLDNADTSFSIDPVVTPRGEDSLGDDRAQITMPEFPSEGSVSTVKKAFAEGGITAQGDSGKKNLSECFFGINSFTIYTAYRVAPEINASYALVPLLENTDFSITYINDADQEVALDALAEGGSYTLRLTGQGDYEGTKDFPLTVKTYESLDGWNYALDAQGNAVLVSSVATGDTVVIPASLNGHCVVRALSKAFSGIKATEKVVIPDSLTNLHVNAFSDMQAPNQYVFMGASEKIAIQEGTSLMLPKKATTKLSYFADMNPQGVASLFTDISAQTNEAVWSYQVLLQEDKNGIVERTLALQASGENGAYHGQSGITKFDQNDQLISRGIILSIPETIDGMTLNMLGTNAIYGQGESLSFSLVYVPASIKKIAPQAFRETHTTAIFQGDCPELIGKDWAVDASRTIVWYPENAQGWNECAWCPEGYLGGAYDPAWNMEYNLDNNTWSVKGFNKNEGEVVIPRFYCDDKVVTLKSGACLDGSKLTKLFITEYVATIESGAVRNLGCPVYFTGGIPAIGQDYKTEFQNANGGTTEQPLIFEPAYAALWEKSPWITTGNYKTFENYECDPLKYEYVTTDVAGEYAIRRYIGSAQAVKIPVQLENARVTVDDVEQTVSGKIVGVGYRAFDGAHGYTALTHLVIPEGIRWIGEAAFWGNRDLYKLTIEGNTLERIDASAFWYTDDLTEITLPASVKEIADAAFTSAGLQNIYVDKDNPYFKDEQGVLFDKSGTELHTYPAGRRDRSYTVPEEVEYIHERAFAHDPQDIDSPLGNIVLPPKLKKIGDQAFLCCYGLRSMIIPDSVEEIGIAVFQVCPKLVEVTLPASLKRVPDSMFSSNESLQTVRFGALGSTSSLKSIGPRAFAWCKGLESIELPEGLETIEEDAFHFCRSLNNVKFPTSLRLIGESAFHTCTSLSAVDFKGIPDLVIGEKSFIQTNISELFIPCTVKDMGYYAFGSCANLERIEFEEGCQLTVIPENAFYAAARLKTLIIPASITTIGSHAFYGCTGFEDEGYIVFLNRGKWDMAQDAFDTLDSEAGVIQDTKLKIKVYGYRGSSTQRFFPARYFCPIDITENEDMSYEGEPFPGNVITLQSGAVSSYAKPVYHWYRNGESLGTSDTSSFDVEVLAAGKVTYSVKVVSSFDSTETCEQSLEMLAGKNILYAWVDDIADQPYTGSEICPVPEVVLDGEVLKLDEDYTISYRDNVEIGCASLTFQGVEAQGITGTFDVTFNIVEKTNLENGRWIDDPWGRWYQCGDGSWPSNAVVMIDGINYGFDEDGYLTQGWVRYPRSDHYLNSDGTVKTGWFKEDGKTYYLDPQAAGAKTVGVKTIEDTTYYFTNAGTLGSGWVKWRSSEYFFDSKGVMVTNDWAPLITGKRYLGADGALHKGWLELGTGLRYYCDMQSGMMATGLTYIDNAWYFFLPQTGLMQMGWQEIHDGWYYFGDDGVLFVDTTTPDGYTVGPDGRRL